MLFRPSGCVGAAVLAGMTAVACAGAVGPDDTRGDDSDQASAPADGLFEPGPDAGASTPSNEPVGATPPPAKDPTATGSQSDPGSPVPTSQAPSDGAPPDGAPTAGSSAASTSNPDPEASTSAQASSCNPGSDFGAPVPMRRLTAAQIERTVLSVLGVDARLNVADERLATFKSNISSPVDSAAARGYLDFAETVAATATVGDCGAGCRDVLLDDIGPRLFRRPLSDAQRQIYAALFDAEPSQDPLDATRSVVEAMLQSPSFLYLDEVTRSDATLDDYSVAARLALTLWNENPDRALLDLAAAGELSDPHAVARQAERMLLDPRSSAGLSEFVSQWLGLARLQDERTRPDIAALGSEVVAALADEPAMLFRQVSLDNGGLVALLTNPQTPALPALLDVYAADVQAQTETLFQLDPEHRAGLLTLPGVMAALSHAQHTSPTLRGYAVMANLLCTPPPPPPAGVSVTLPEVGPDATARERLALHSTDPSCGSCHATMDGIGLSFESYDWLGRYRSEEAGAAIDDSSTFMLGGDPVTVDGAVELAHTLASSRTVAACVVRQWARYSSGVNESSDVSCLLEQLTDVVSGEKGLKSMLLATLTSDWLLKGPQVQP